MFPKELSIYVALYVLGSIIFNGWMMVRWCLDTLLDSCIKAYLFFLTIGGMYLLTKLP